MKRVLQLVFVVPLVLFMAVLLTLVWPLWRFFYWLTEDDAPGVGVRDLWADLWSEFKELPR